MKYLLILVTNYLSLFQIIDSKLHRVLLEDKILPHIDNSIPPLSDQFSLDNLILEQIDDDNVELGGYIESIKQMDRNLPLALDFRTQIYENARWNEAAYRLTVPSVCYEFINPNHFWYNITKLWTLDVCPSRIGDKWEIDTDSTSLIYDVPPSMPIVPWRIYIVVSQGIPGFEKIKYGFGLKFQFIPI